MNEQDELRSTLPDSDMQAVPRALLRAAKRAREIARETGTPLVIVRDGVLVYEDVSGEEESAAVPATSPARTGRSSPR